MIRITRVLCPVDFSECSHHAASHAAAIARWYEAQLTLLHVYPNVPAMDLPPVRLSDADRQHLTARLRKSAEVIGGGDRVQLLVEEAESVHGEILECLRSTQADLLVLGTHGRSGFQRFLLGSIAEKVIRKATCPVLVVPPRVPEMSAQAPVRFSTILCPVDFSESSLDALAYAFSMAEEADAQLTLLHVVEIPSVVAEGPMLPPLDLSRARELAADRARRRLDDLIPAQARDYCTVTTVVAEGRAAREILREAAERQADLIVMGVHERRAADVLGPGSTSHHVIRASVCPVLIAGHR